MADDRIGVVVISHNRRDELDRTLSRLAALPEAPPVVVIDNGSSDGSAARVRERYPDVTLLTPGVNLGAAGRNIGVTALPTCYVGFCDDDTWWEPGALSAAADVLDAHPRLAVVTARICVEPDGTDDPMSEEMSRSPIPSPDGIPGHPLLSFMAGVSVVRRSAFLAAGGFSRRLWLGGEEELLAADLVTSGWHLTYLPGIVAHHEASMVRNADRRRRNGIRNTLWFTWLRRRRLGAIRRTAQLVSSLPRDRLSALGVLDAVRGLPWVLRDRAPVPRQVEAAYRLLDRMQRGSRARRYVS